MSLAREVKSSNYKNMIDGQGPILLPMDVQQVCVCALRSYVVEGQTHTCRTSVCSDVGPCLSIKFYIDYFKNYMLKKMDSC